MLRPHARLKLLVSSRSDHDDPHRTTLEPNTSTGVRMKLGLMITTLVAAVAVVAGSAYWFHHLQNTTATQDVRSRPDALSSYDPAAEPNKRLMDDEEQLAWQSYFNRLSPKAGQIAPDFELKDTRGKETFRLSDYRGKQPVALIFGSFT